MTSSYEDSGLKKKIFLIEYFKVRDRNIRLKPINTNISDPPAKAGGNWKPFFQTESIKDDYLCSGIYGANNKCLNEFSIDTYGLELKECDLVCL